MELNKLSYAELLDLKSKLDVEIKSREQEEKAKAKKQIMDLAKAHGLTIEEVLGKSGGVRKPVEAKYRHPQHPELTWTGRGRKPVWVQELLNAGKTMQDLAI
ncbi:MULTISPECIES: H-NS family nucleoid-associated regulatory protein [unclassified Paludibacterium]|uniref:H-NS histone family protein n=1 Tax=unclassified Paludibacterium TaxID=2618429 RepID=UPI001C04C826|nr:H-NS histone family protein [Paludibacterium sp. B53371]BEV73797.1 H-NS histone family protein [Paludibacterium sp. THUN1379]